MADSNGPVLGAPVDPPEDVWLSALSGALDDPRSPEELDHLIPSDEPSSRSLDEDAAHSDDTDDRDDWFEESADLDGIGSHPEHDHGRDDAGDVPGDSWDDPSTSG